MIISFNFEQLENAKLPISFTDDGIVIFTKDLHPSKAFSSIDSTEDGIVISAKFEQL